MESNNTLLLLRPVYLFTIVMICYLPISGCAIQATDPEGEHQDPPANIDEPDISPPRGQGSQFIRTALVYYGGGPHLVPGDEEWLAKYDLISIDRHRYDDIGGQTWAAIKSISPETEIYLYCNSRVANFMDEWNAENINNIARYSNSRGHSMGDLNIDNPDFFTLGRDSTRLYSISYSTPDLDLYNYQMDYSNGSFSDYWIEAVLTDIVNEVWVADGVFGDNLSPLFPSDLGNAVPRNPTIEGWTDAVEGHVKQVTAELRNRNQKFWANRGHTRIAEGYDAWIRLDASSDAPAVLMEEGAFAVKWGSNDVQFYPESHWRRQVEILREVRNSKISMLSHTKLDEGESGYDNHGHPVGYYQILWYSLTSFLLGREDNAYFMFHGSDGYSRDWWYDEYEEIDLGASRGNYLVLQVDNRNIYYREFDDGYVFVNPSPHTVAGILLPEPLRMLTHDTFRQTQSLPFWEQIELPPFTGVVLMR